MDELVVADELIDAIKDQAIRNQMRQFKDGWVAGVQTALTLAIGEQHSDGGEPFTGQHSPEFLAWVQDRLRRVESA